MGVGEVEGIEGVGRGVMGLLLLWKCVEKSKPHPDEPTPRGSGTVYPLCVT